MAASRKLFQPLRVGTQLLQHRIAMAPLTRLRNGQDDGIPLDISIEYYSQRAAEPGTLLVSEGVPVSAWARGTDSLPGIYTDAQVAQWKKIVDAIHAKGSLVSIQLWALGRASDPKALSKIGKPLVSASDKPLSDDGTRPRPLTEGEIKLFVEDFAQGARRAVFEAGFDFVEIHGANGYLVDQFTQDLTNQRTDRYGGSVENRARFALEVVKAVTDAVGAERTGIRLSPHSTYQRMGMQDPVPQFTYLIQQLASFRLAYLHLNENRRENLADLEPLKTLDFALQAYGKAGPVIVTGGWTSSTVEKAAAELYKDDEIIFGFGKSFISNPDLAYRLKHGLTLSQYNIATFYGPATAEGYTSYPFSEQYLEHLRAIGDGVAPIAA